MAELADALDLGSGGATREGSIPFYRNSQEIKMIDKMKIVINIMPYYESCDSTL